MPSLKDMRVRINSVRQTRKITSAMKLVAASKLRRAQVRYDGAAEAALFERLAREKAEAVYAASPVAFVLGADTTVVVDSAILAKPGDAAVKATEPIVR